MKRKNVELFWEHPGRYVFGFFLTVTVACILLTYMPKWFNAVCTILLIAILIKYAIKLEMKERKENNN